MEKFYTLLASQSWSEILGLVKTEQVVFAYFGAFRSVISGLSDHPFRFKPITDSAIIRSLLA